MEAKEDVLKKSWVHDKAVSLTKTLQEVIKNSPETLPSILKEMKKFDGIEEILNTDETPISEEGQWIKCLFIWVQLSIF